ncbi:MAG: hypothetical protein LBU74_01010 [Methanobacteriaceae archaeon]|nr:hypothetical protein [Candidatus Methanorudis spinitermitis]
MVQHTISLQMTTHNFTRPHFALKKESPKRIKGKVWKKHDKMTSIMSI